MGHAKMLHLCTEKKTGNERKSLWQVWTYDVLGNETDGYEVNDRCKIASTHELTEYETLFNVGTEREFLWWSASDNDIRDALGISDKLKIIVAPDGDHNVIYVTLLGNDYPLGELIRVDSLGRIVQ